MKGMRIGWLVLAFCLWAATVFAAVPEDFSCRGVAIGEEATEAALTEAFGAALFDQERSVFGLRVKYYTFRDDFVVGVTPKDGRVVDIVIKSRDYAGRCGVRCGATPYKITQVFGKVERQFIDGVTWYIYQNPDAPEERLMLEAELPGATLLSWRITSLPLTEEEMDARWDEEWESQDFGAAEMQAREIDMSALTGRDDADADRRYPPLHTVRAGAAAP
ncbi:MAG: hypothetical protein ACTTKW_02515 [Schwartzia sp. (in: firmicutes)]